jgi:hypothetical protein
MLSLEWVDYITKKNRFEQQKGKATRAARIRAARRLSPGVAVGILVIRDVTAPRFSGARGTYPAPVRIMN